MENKKELRNWLDAFNLDHPLVIAGPCSAETEEQVLKIAHELKDTDATVFRAGIWKPRTRPGMFEGVGALGLKWLQKAKEETGMLTTTEVANPNHVELALKHDVDILWIGARTTVSPFNIQEIAEIVAASGGFDLDAWLNQDFTITLDNYSRLVGNSYGIEMNDFKDLGLERGYLDSRLKPLTER